MAMIGCLKLCVEVTDDSLRCRGASRDAQPANALALTSGTVW